MGIYVVSIVLFLAYFIYVWKSEGNKPKYNKPTSTEDDLDDLHNRELEVVKARIEQLLETKAVCVDYETDTFFYKGKFYTNDFNEETYVETVGKNINAGSLLVVKTVEEKSIDENYEYEEEFLFTKIETLKESFEVITYFNEDSYHPLREKVLNKPEYVIGGDGNLRYKNYIYSGFKITNEMKKGEKKTKHINMKYFVVSETIHANIKSYLGTSLNMYIVRSMLTEEIKKRIKT